MVFDMHHRFCPLPIPVSGAEARNGKAENLEHKTRERVAKTAHSRMSSFRKLPVQLKKLASCLGSLMFARTIIAFHKANVI